MNKYYYNSNMFLFI